MTATVTTTREVGTMKTDEALLEGEALLFVKQRLSLFVCPQDTLAGLVMPVTTRSCAGQYRCQ